MSRKGLSVFAIEPHAEGLRSLLQRFAEQPGAVTSFDELRLPLLRGFLSDEEDVEVVPLPELYSRQLTLIGLPAGKIPPASQLAELSSLICSQLNDGSVLARNARHPGLHRRIVATLSELRRHGWHPDSLVEAAEGLPPGSAEKIRSLGEIWRRMNERLDAGGRNNASDHATLALGVPDWTPAVDRLFVDLAGEDNPVALAWLKRLAESGAEVWVALDAVTPRAELFPLSSRAAKLLGHSLPPVENLSWAYRLFVEDEPVESAPDVEIWSTAEILAECEWVVRACHRAHTEEAVPLDRIGIYCRDIQTYAPLLQVAAEAFGVRIRSPLQAPVITNGFASLTTLLLEALAGSDVRALLSVARSSYVEMRPEGIAALSTAVREARCAREGQWQAIETWAAAPEQGEEFEWLTHVLAWRSEVLSAPAPLREWIERMRTDLIGESRLPLSSSNPELASFARDQRAQTAMQRALVNRAAAQDAVETRSWSLAEFARLCRQAWEEDTYVIPSDPHGVRVARQATHLGECDLVFALGMLEGILPKRRVEDAVLLDSERRALSAARPDLPSLRDSHDQVATERDEFVRLCLAARQKLVITYPLTEEDRDNIPCFYLERLRKKLGDRVAERHHPREELTPPLDQVRLPSDLMLRLALDQEPTAVRVERLATERAKAQLRPERPPSVSVRELADTLRCEFRATFRHRLSVRGGDRRDPWRAITVLPDRVQLATRANPDEAREALRQELDNQVEKLYGDLEEWETHLLVAGGRRLIDEWVAREFTARQAWPPEDLVGKVRLGTADLVNQLKYDEETKWTFTGEASAAYRIGPTSVLRIATQRNADSVDEWEQFGKRGDLVEFGLFLLAQGRRAKSYALDLERAQERVLVLLRGDQDLVGGSLRSNTQAKLKVVKLGTSREEFLSKVKSAAREALAKIEQAEVIAEPEEKLCMSCRYGELCRVSAEFGDAIEPAEENGREE